MDTGNERGLLIRAGRLISAVAGEKTQERRAVLVRGGVIAAVGGWDELAPEPDVAVIDAEGQTLMPGLIDAHTHVIHSGEPGESWLLNAVTELPAATALKAALLARRHLDMGVTTIRDVGSRDWVDIALRDAIDAGLYQGPRMLVAGHGITSTSGHMDPRKHFRPGIGADAIGMIGVVADGPDEARRAAWEQIGRGADLVKINATLSEYVRARGGQCSPEMTLETMRAICEVAHAVQRKVAAHCHGGPGVSAAIEAGVDTFEHGRFLTDEQIAAMAERGAFLVPTLSPEARRVDQNDPPKDAGDRRWYTMATEAMYRTVERAHRAGVAVAAGTDAGMPYVRHGDLAYEVFHLAQAGLSSLEAIVAATRVAAAALGLEGEVGEVRPGLAADLVVVDGDPLADLRLLQRREAIQLVFRRGNVAVDRRAVAQSVA